VRSALEEVADPCGLPALHQILPEYGLDHPDQRYSEIDALETLIELLQANAPLLLVLDDLHWADPATLGAIAYLQRRCAGVGLAIVGAASSKEASPAHPMRRLAPSLVVELDPLMRDDLSALTIPRLDERTDENLAVGSGRPTRR
jgi:predicted ATPase